MAIYPPLSTELYNIFHSIDRRLFSILVFSLGRDPTHAIQVMGLWLWLERAALKSTIVHSILTLSFNLVETIFDESVTCLNLAFGHPPTADIPVLSALLRSKNIAVSLAYFDRVKAELLQGVAKQVDGVCARAFSDIIERYNVEGSLQRAAAQEQEARLLRQAYERFEMAGNNGGGVVYPDDCLSSYQDEIDEVLECSRMQRCPVDEVAVVSVVEERAGREPARERGGGGSNNKTLFLTFSKGYPISKLEVRDFFTRLFGDIIEGLYMQEVPNGEQPLYARLVVREPHMMDIVLRMQRKIKFSINGKHACVRKYVRRRSESPPSPQQSD